MGTCTGGTLAMQASTPEPRQSCDAISWGTLLLGNIYVRSVVDHSLYTMPRPRSVLGRM